MEAGRGCGGETVTHSTETALFKVVNPIRRNTDAGKASVLAMLVLSAAFDTVHHSILLHRLEKWVGFSGAVVKWLKSYLQDRSFFVAVGNCAANHLQSISFGLTNVGVLFLK